MEKTTPTVKPPGRLTNDFSEQEQAMTASAMPPRFALTAGAVNPPNEDVGEIPATQQATLLRLGLSEAEIADLHAKTAAEIVSASIRFTPEEWHQLWPAVHRLGLGPHIAQILEDFYEKGQWLTSPNAVSLAVLEGFSYTNAEGKKMGGFLELVQEGDHIGIRAIIPYDDFGKTLILNPKKTTTVLGRAVDAAKHPDGYKGAMNMPVGTNYFRFQQDAMVGESSGGTNVLDIADWTWAKNNAWLQAAVDRGDNIRFISDPMVPSNIYWNEDDVDNGLTVTGQELGVLLNQGFAPDQQSGVVRSCQTADLLGHPRHWQNAKEAVVNNGSFEDIDMDAYWKFRYTAKSPDRTRRVAKDKAGNILEFQSNFFGGVPKPNESEG